MKTRREAIEMCLTYADAYEDYPFHDSNWTVMRHKTNRKSFAYIFEHEGCIWINVKCDPMDGDFLKSAYPAIVPAYHMNKTHWIGVRLDGTMSDDEIMPIIAQSFYLTQTRGR